MVLDVDGVGDAAAMLEGEVGQAVDEAHRAAIGVFVGDEVEGVAPLPEVRFASVGFCPGFDLGFQALLHALLDYFLKAVRTGAALLDVIDCQFVVEVGDVDDGAKVRDGIEVCGS